MTSFNSRFKHSAIRQLSETFRCPQDLCNITSQFVVKNAMQLKKSVRSRNPSVPPSIRVVALPDRDSIEDRVRLNLAGLYKKVPDVEKPEFRCKVMLLGRYKSDAPQSLALWQKELGDRLELTYFTVHASKGLEADVVLVLNVTEGKYGFPCQVDDDPILKLVLLEPESYEHGEERRLFYVALTRAKRSVVVYTTQDRPSRFLVELQAESNGPQIVNVEGVASDVCPKCGKGTVVDKLNRRTQQIFKSCSRHPKCDGKLSKIQNYNVN